jgi:hypothetical protein
MKTIKDLKVGDKAFDVRFGEVTITSINNEDTYPITATSTAYGYPSYTSEGKIHNTHTFPILYVTNPFIANQGKWMMVSGENRNWKKRFVFAKKNGKFIAWCSSETDEDLLKEDSTATWTYAKEIEEETIPEYTMEQLVAKLGNFKIKK